MRMLIVRALNRAHGNASPWVRRPATVVGLLALLALTLAFYAILPALIVIIVAWDVLKAAWESIAEVPLLTINQVRGDWGDWRRNVLGSVRIWQAQKAAM